MNKKRMYIILFSLILLSLFAAAVSAQLLDPILKPLEQIDIVGTYARFGFIIDTILYFVILIGAAQAGLGERFKDQKSIVVAVGIALAIGAAIGEVRTGFRLGNFWPLALIMGILAIGFAVYGYFKKISGTQNKGFAMLGFAFLFFYIQSVPGLKTLKDQFEKSPNEYVRLIWSVITIIAIVCIFWGLWELARGIARWGSEGAVTPPTPTPGPAGAGGPSWWSRFRDRRDRRNQGRTLDYANTGTLIVNVVDIKRDPIAGSEVRIVGKKWRYRVPFLKEVRREHADEEGKATFQNVPSGMIKITALHPGYKFYKFIDRARNIISDDAITQVMQGVTTEVTIQLRREEEGGMITGRVVGHQFAAARKISPKKDGEYIYKGFRDERIGSDKENIGVFNLPVAAFRIDPSTRNPVRLSVPTRTNRFGDFAISGLPVGSNIFAVATVEGDDHRLADVDHTMGDYGRGGQRGSNKRPPKEIILSTFHKHEKYVIIDVILKKQGDENTPAGAAPPPPKTGEAGKGTAAEGISSEESEKEIEEGAEKIKENYQQESAGMEEAVKKLADWADKLRAIKEISGFEKFVGYTDEVKQLGEDIDNFRKRMDMTYKIWREKDNEINIFIDRIKAGKTLEDTSPENIKEFIRGFPRMHAVIDKIVDLHVNKTVYRNPIQMVNEMLLEEGNRLSPAFNDRAKKINSLREKMETYKRMRDKEIKETLEVLEEDVKKIKSGLDIPAIEEVEKSIRSLLARLEELKQNTFGINMHIIEIMNINRQINEELKNFFYQAEKEAESI